MNQKGKIKLGLKILVSILLLGWLLCSVEWPQICHCLHQIKPFALIWAVFSIIVAMIISVVKWGLLIHAQRIPASWKDLWQAYWVALFFNNFLPSSIGGDGMRIFLVGKKTGDMAGVSVSVVAERVLATLGIACIGLPALILTGTSLKNLKGLFVLLLLGSLVGVWLLIWGKVPGFLKGKQGKGAVFLSRFISHGGRLKEQPGVIGKVVLWSALFQLANVAVNYFIFQGLGLTGVSFLEAMLVVPAAAAISMVPVGINGYGIREGAYITLLAPFGVQPAAAFTASVLYAFLVSLCSLWGGMLWIGIKKKEGELPVGTESFGNQ
ncbi:lysylphosphatidylglycerol synthase transmembrane domain-containing protein [Candidatus Formimonas warabiya]|nr:lysylphosphatidylglycerol synthase transmembrane domain-containing protein [Candidatus Formimonas warabiya]